ncbi:response regulator [Lactiplantibacillus herbarum]|uniref:response regulator n=1 Tax=Lactiplantibacillus herbarum TaxID=1670446 RepID=UPI00064EAFBD|nr:response regulator [Lactiplantibacillus herbarum]
MLNIIICEDNTDLLNLYQYILNSEITKGDTEAQITLASENPTEVLTYIQKHHDPTQHYLYILDLEFSDSITKGVDIAEEIYKNDESTKIIFLTIHHELEKIELKEQLHYHDFIDKSIGISAIKDRLITDFDTIIAEQAAPQSIVHMQRGPKSFDVPANEINYFRFESKSAKNTAFGPNLITEFSTPIEEILKCSPNFFKVKKDIIINLESLQYVDHHKKDIYFKNGTELQFNYLQIRQIEHQLDI